MVTAIFEPSTTRSAGVTATLRTPQASVEARMSDNEQAPGGEATRAIDDGSHVTTERGLHDQVAHPRRLTKPPLRALVRCAARRRKRGVNVLGGILDRSRAADGRSKHVSGGAVDVDADASVSGWRPAPPLGSLDDKTRGRAVERAVVAVGIRIVGRV
jgi:hypothetical protein